jgi:glycosyltransferase involved in cell wall biosynthesis
MELIKKGIVFGILARDCAKTLPCNIELVEILRSYFEFSVVVVVENDSIDRTKEILYDWACKSDNIYIDSFNEQSKTTSQLLSNGLIRIEKMVRYRNRLLDNIRKFPQTDYIVFIDIDILQFSIEGVISAIRNAPPDWGGLFANGQLYIETGKQIRPIRLQYDTYAYLNSNERIHDLKINTYSIKQQYYRGKKMQQSIQRTGYFPCVSAFGGIGIYNTKAISHLYYKLEKLYQSNNTDIYTCEHIPFNQAIIDAGYTNYICRDLKVIYGIQKSGWIKGLLLYYYPLTFNLFHLLLNKY